MQHATRILVVVTFFGSTGCGDGGETGGPAKPVCADQLCVPGATICIGNSVAKCVGGVTFDLSSCGDLSQQQCVQGKCEPRTCTPGRSQCKDKSTASVCNATGTAYDETVCETGEVCTAGACRAVVCTAGESVCGWRAFATCQAGGAGWKETTCSNTEVCSGGQCVPQACQANVPGCADDKTPRTCLADGSGWKAGQPCGAGEACTADYPVCLPVLCTAPGDGDATGPTDVLDGPEGTGEDVVLPVDKGPLPELEKLDTAVCTIDGTKVKFTSNLSASYVETAKDLRISMDYKQQKLEVSLKPLEELDVGHWTSAEATEVSVNMYYNDGSELPPGAQFKYVSVEYDFELLKFEVKGGRVSGNFTGALTSDQGVTTIPMTDCVFDVKRHD